MVGLAVAGGARLGVVYRPDPGILYFGTAAGGAWSARLREDRARDSGEDDGGEGGAGPGSGPDPADRPGGRLGDPASGPDRPPGSMRETGPRDRDGGEENGAGQGAGDGEPEVEDLGDFREPAPLSLDAARDGAVRIIHSRSHTPDGLDRLAEALGETELIPSGSAGLKCARIAAGEADLYVHPVPYLKEWDTCAPDALLRGAGGRVTDCRGRPLRYGKEERAQLGGLFAARPEVWEAASDAVRSLAPEEAPDG
jgi:3'-phosphoadenosine 5'-phosphosulfate (PAPS) 3'-phosphatase